MFDSSQPYTFDRVVRMLLTAALLVGLFYLLRYLSDVLVPFAAAAVLAYFLNPLVAHIERLTKTRRRAVALTLTGLVIVGFSLALLAIPLMTHQVRRFENDLQRLKNDIAASIMPGSTQPVTNAAPGIGIGAGAPPGGEAQAARANDAADTAQADALPDAPRADEEFEIGFGRLKDAWGEYLGTAEEQPRSRRLRALRQRLDGTAVGTVVDQAIAYVQTTEFSAMVVELLRRIAVGGVSVLNFTLQLILGATVIVLILLYLVFLLMDYPNYKESWKTFLPPAYRQRVLDFLEEFEIVLRRYFYAQFLIASLTGILFAVGFSLIGLPMAIPFGLFIGVLNMVPYLQIVAIVPAALLAVLRSVGGDSSLLASFVWVGVVFAVVQFVQDGLITPRIMGKVTGLSPIAILLGMFIWGKLLGFLGLLLAIPLTCIGIAYYRRFVLQHTQEETDLKVEPR